MSWTGIVKQAWVGIAVVGFSVGILNGGVDYVNDYMINRKPVELLQFKFLESIINCSLDVGMLVSYLAYYGGFSALVAATFPISVPVLIKCFRA